MTVHVSQRGTRLTDSGSKCAPRSANKPLFLDSSRLITMGLRGPVHVH